MNVNDLDTSMRESLAGHAPEDARAMTERHFDALAAKLRAAAPMPKPARPALWWLWPGLSLAGAAALVLFAAGLLFTPTPSWAQVVEKFRSLRFLNVTLYVTSNPGEPPEKLEVWASQDHRSRVHYRGLIIFGRDGAVVKVLRADTGAEMPVDTLRATTRDENRRQTMPLADFALGIPQTLARTPHFSLQDFLSFAGGRREQMQPVANLDAGIAPDMEVFDLVTPQSPEWLRLWVLKRSELPVRVRSWDPRSGSQTEAVFDYFTQMPEEAFDPDKVRAGITAREGKTNKLYALLKDPGKRPLTPEQTFAANGYHLPEIESAGRTEDGVLWVLSRHGINRTATGRMHYGWGVLEDNLGQAYSPALFVASTLDGEKTLEYFLPADYRLGYQLPQSYKLTCTDADPNWPEPAAGTVIGATKLEQWKNNAPLPALFKNQPVPDATQFTMWALRRAFYQKDWDRLDRLSATIPGEPAVGDLALIRDILQSEKLDRTGDANAAETLRAKIFPLITEIAKGKFWGEEGEAMVAHVVSLLRTGQRDEARRAANASVAALVRTEQRYHLVHLLEALRRSGMTEAEMRSFFDVDVFGIPYVQEEWNRTKEQR